MLVVRIIVKIGDLTKPVGQHTASTAPTHYYEVKYLVSRANWVRSPTPASPNVLLQQQVVQELCPVNEEGQTGHHHRSSQQAEVEEVVEVSNHDDAGVWLNLQD